MDGPSIKEMGLTPKEMGITEKSLGGHDLPQDWPRLISNDETLRISSTLPEADRELPIRHFSYELSSDTHNLSYLAVRHSEDPAHPHNSEIESRFIQFQPDMVLYEGPVDKSEIPNRDDSFKYGGEKGLIRWLIQNRNKNLQPGEAPIQEDSGDIPTDELIKNFQVAGFSNEQIASNLTARLMYFMSGGPDSTQDLAQLESIFTQYFDDPGELGLKAKELSLVSRSDGQEWTLNLIRDEYKSTTGQDLRINNNYPIDLKKMFDKEPEFRDTYIINKISEAAKLHKRIMVVMGSAHPIRQEPALRQLFDQPLEITEAA